MVSPRVVGQVGVAGSVLESYRAMLAFRRAQAALVSGNTRFLDAPEPVLAFWRGDQVLCVFNLSPGAVEVTVEGLGAALEPAQAIARKGDLLKLGGNGYGFFAKG